MRRLTAITLIVLGATWPGAALAQRSGRFIPFADVSVTTTAATIRAANANRKALVCTNTDATIHVRVGGTTAPTITLGVQLRAGATITITSPDKVQMIAESGTVTVACTEEVE